MGTRTVRLDEEAEKELARLRRLTGLSISEVLKRGLLAYRTQALQQPVGKAYDIYAELDLGAGGHARAPADKAKAGVVGIIRRKHGR